MEKTVDFTKDCAISRKSVQFAEMNNLHRKTDMQTEFFLQTVFNRCRPSYNQKGNVTVECAVFIAAERLRHHGANDNVTVIMYIVYNIRVHTVWNYAD